MWACWAEQVGPPYLMHREDMEKVAPLWFNFTYAVRNDPQVNPPLAFLSSLQRIMLHPILILAQFFNTKCET